jgi:hypothetical protein
MKTNRRRLLSVALGGLLMLMVSAPAGAAEGIRLKVSVVHATKTKGKADPGLAHIHRSLQQAFGAYTSFKRVAKHELSLTKGKKISIKLPNRKSAAVTYKGKVGAQHLITLAIPESKVNVDLRALPRRIFYQAGLKHKNGILILAFYLKE